MKSKVYFSKTITPEKVLELYQLVGKPLPGKTAIKLHSGEVGNQNFLKPAFWKPVIDYVGGTVTECNTAYEGERNTKDRIWSWIFRPENRSRKITSEKICQNMILCLYFLILKDILWADTAER